MSPPLIPLVVLAAGLGRRFGGPKQLAPVGPHGELLLDYTAHDARAAGFSPIVLVVRDEIDKVLAAHVARSWPRSLPVIFARQAVPAGTADAVLAGRSHLTSSFAVVNADDIYPSTAYAALYAHLASTGGAASQHAVVGFALGASIVGNGPVTRGVCQGDREGRLIDITELVVRREPKSSGNGELSGMTGSGTTVPLEWASTVSMNMWGFRQSMLGHLERAVDRAQDSPGAKEVILPDVVSEFLVGPTNETVVILPEKGNCLGMTHGEDLPQLVKEVGQLVHRGDRPSRLWESGGQLEGGGGHQGDCHQQDRGAPQQDDKGSALDYPSRGDGQREGHQEEPGASPHRR